MYWRILRVFDDRSAWNQQYEAGVWRADEVQRSATLLDLIREYDHRSIVEFGCGQGSLPRQIEGFDKYVGYDISDYAIARAGSHPKCQFAQLDMKDWKGDEGIDLILAEECLYYLSGVRLEEFLLRVKQSLSPHGKFIVVVHSDKHQKTLESAARVLTVFRQFKVGSRTYQVLHHPSSLDRHAKVAGVEE